MIPAPLTRIDYQNVAVLIPCFNEEITIEKVVRDFKRTLPGAKIYVFDNNSVDQTAVLARNAGAQVVLSPTQGKGAVVQHMFSVVDAQVYVMVDGDDTYPADAAPAMIAELESRNVDMVVGTRIRSHVEKSFRRFHKIGNIVITTLISSIFKISVSDVLSGYRVFSRKMVKTVPLSAPGFEVETELTLQAAAKRYSVREVQISYGERPAGSESKLNTWSDGILILRAITTIFKDYKPLVFFGTLSLLLGFASFGIGIFPILDYVREHYVHRVPLAILATGLGILSVLCFGIGLILDTTHKYHYETFDVWRRNL